MAARGPTGCWTASRGRWGSHDRRRARTSWCPTLGEGLEDATITAGRSRWVTTSNSTRRCARWRPTRPRSRFPVRTRAGSSNCGGAEGETLAVGSVLIRIATDVEQPSPEAGPSRKPVLVGYGADDDMDVSRRATAPPSDRPRAKPPVRKLAAELNVDLSGRAGSGPDGVITREDVLAAAASRRRARTWWRCVACRPRWRTG